MCIGGIDFFVVYRCVCGQNVNMFNGFVDKLLFGEIVQVFFGLLQVQKIYVFGDVVVVDWCVVDNGDYGGVCGLCSYYLWCNCWCDDGYFKGD